MKQKDWRKAASALEVVITINIMMTTLEKGLMVEKQTVGKTEKAEE